MSKNVNELYVDYNQRHQDYNVMNSLYSQALKLGLNEYNKGYQFSIEEDEAKSIIGYTLTYALKKYNPNNERKVTFTTYLTKAIINNLGLYGKREKKLDEDNNSQQLKQMSINDPIGYDREGKALPLESVLGVEDLYLEEEHLEEMIDEMVKGAIYKYDENVPSKVERYEILKTVVMKLLEDKSYEQIAKEMNINHRQQIFQYVKKLQESASKMEEFKGLKSNKRFYSKK